MFEDECSTLGLLGCVLKVELGDELIFEKTSEIFYFLIKTVHFSEFLVYYFFIIDLSKNFIFCSYLIM